MIKKSLVLCIIIMFMLNTVSASDAMPDLKQSINNVLAMFKDKQKSLSPELKALQRKKIFQIALDLFDFTEMSKRTIGKNWKSITPEKQKEFSHLFARFLANIYYNRLEEYTNETVKFVDERQHKNKVLIKTVVVTSQNEIPMDYKLVKSDKWRVYDVSIEGVSLIRNYRSQFNKILRKQGIDDLIAMMKKKLGQFSDL